MQVTIAVDTASTLGNSGDSLDANLPRPRLNAKNAIETAGSRYIITFGANLVSPHGSVKYKGTDGGIFPNSSDIAEIITIINSKALI